MICYCRAAALQTYCQLCSDSPAVAVFYRLFRGYSWFIFLSKEYFMFISPPNLILAPFFCPVLMFLSLIRHECPQETVNALQMSYRNRACYPIWLVPVSNALYSIYLLWDVVLMFMCVSGLSEPTNIIWNQGPVLTPHATLVAQVIECLDGGWRLWTD